MTRIRDRSGDSPDTTTATSLARLLMPLWSGVVLGLAELGPALARLPSGVPARTLVASCVACGLLLSLPWVPLAWLARAGVVQLWGRVALRQPRRLLALGWALCCYAVGAFQLVRRLLVADLARPELGASFAVAALLLWALVCMGMFRLVVGVLSGLERRRLPALPLAVFGLVAIAALLIGPSLGALLASLVVLPRTAVLAGAAWLLFALALSLSDRLLSGRWLRRLAAIPPALVVVLTPLSLAGLERSAASRAALSQTHWLSMVPSAIVALSDRDGDGHTSRLGGADCDDSDAAVHPGALEVLGNDRDEDCDGEALTDDPTVGTLDGRLHGDGCDVGPRLPAETNVLLVVVDALRSDRLEGGERVVMPNLSRFAEQAVRFERCYTPHPSTAYAMPALFTGMYTRWARDLFRSQLADIPLSRALPQTLLAPLGYQSAAVYGHFLAGHRHAMTRGIDRRVLRKERVSAEGVVEDTLRFIDEIVADGAPFFSYAHFYDPHWEYVANDDAPWPQDSRVDRYDGELFRVDHALGRLFAALEQRELLAHTLVVVVSDHGEELGEHGGEFHGHTMFEEVIRVPCLMRHPSLKSRRVSQPVSLVDVLPTLRSLLGIDSDAPLQGVSLVPLMAGDRCRRGPVVGEMQPWAARPPVKPWLWYLIDGRYKLIRDVARDSEQLFDLESDAAERTNLVEQQPELLARMRRTMAEAVRAHIALPIDSEARRRLAF